MLIMLEPFDESRLALEWVKHVDGKSILPKLTVHLRNHDKKIRGMQELRTLWQKQGT